MVSVIIPVKNGHKTLSRAVQSAINQSLEPNEVIIINDNSDDGTAELIAKLETNYPGKVKSFENMGSGTSNARNLGVTMAHSELIAFLDADDYWESNKLERQVPLHVGKFEMISLTYAAYVKMDGTIIGQSRYFPNDDVAAISTYTLKELPGVLSSWMISKKTFLNAGSFNPNFKFAQDYDFFMRAIKCGVEIHIIPEYLTNYTISDTSVTTQNYLSQSLFARYVREDNRNSLSNVKDYVENTKNRKYSRNGRIYCGLYVRKALTVNKSHPLWRIQRILFLLLAFIMSPREFKKKYDAHFILQEKEKPISKVIRLSLFSPRRKRIRRNVKHRKDQQIQVI
jgi:glycosyltransferase involved in cell wall biosynthesis